MATSTQDVRERLVRSAEHCYYSGATAGQMWLHDLSGYLQTLPEDDPRLGRLAGDERVLEGTEDVLCSEPQPLVQAFDPSAWLDRFAARAAQQ